MSKKTKRWLIAATGLLIAGILMFGGTFAMLDWDFTKLSESKYDTVTHTVTDTFDSLSVSTLTADVSFVLSEDGKTTIICHEQKNRKHAVSVQDGTLVIEVEDTRKWYEYIDVDFDTPTITVSLPRTEYETLSIDSSTGDVTVPSDFRFNSLAVSQTTGSIDCAASVTGAVSIKTTTGNICVKNAAVGSLDLSATTGGITLSKVTCAGDVRLSITTGSCNISDLTCNNLTSTGCTGKNTMSNLIANGKLVVERTVGDVTLDGCDAAEIAIETGTGDVRGHLLSDKVFITNTSTGSIDVPKSITGGLCEIRTTTGNITMTVG